ncbi:ABC transporter permease [Nocardia otitidiscaviarum]|uniref:ABC transporter permease n=1 Tax=Nocardia otitidiscaviarum TaxID=1823 RepID=A0A516NG38_9NOCA|nr:ABC transporter permease [Nocardia otitidiscaviarum]MCP9623225.1 ABC transporter permease [Nocardia otitidiscaviarum]QDP77873.1 ABC transporter permease [Nocardia otitidiscaviarum]
MTTAVLPRPHTTETVFRAADFAGTGQMLRLFLRRDRIVLPLWVLLLSLPLGSVYIESIASVYPDEAGRVGFARSILASPAQLAMYGPIYDTGLGAVGIWKAGMFFTLLGIATILTVIRHTRAEEETGRGELVASTRIGRFAGLTAALVLGLGGALATGLLGTLSLLGTSVPASGSLAFGLALAGSGAVFAAVAAVAAQVSPSARTARGIAFAVLAATYTLRAIGDARAGDGPTSVLTWLSPQGWSLQVRAYAGDHFAVLLLHLVTVTVLTAVAYTLLAHRDLGGGLIAERSGALRAGPALSGPLGLAWRLQRGSLLAWTVGLALYGLVFGSVVYGIGDELGDSEMIRELIQRMGGAQLLEDAMLNYGFTMLSVAATAYAISAALRLHGEEAAQHAETVLTVAVSRIRWAASHLVIALLGPAVILTVAGTVGGLVYGRAAGDVSGKLGAVLGAALVQLPAIWLFVGVVILLFGVAPRWTPVAWGVFVAAVAVFLLGAISGAPQWFRNLDPYQHAPKLPGAEFTATPLVIITLLAATLITVGLFGFRRRDLR